MAEREVIYSQSDKNNFKRYLHKYLRHWPLFIISLAVCLGLATVYLKLVNPRYLITSTILIRDIDKGPDFQAGNPAFKDLDIFNSATSIENEIEALKSVTLMQRVLSELSLQTSYYVDGAIRKREVYGSQAPIRMQLYQLKNFTDKKSLTVSPREANTFELAEDGFGKAVYKFGQPIVRPYGTFTVQLNEGTAAIKNKVYITINNIQDLTASYNKDLNVAQTNKKANVLMVSLMHPVPEKGRDILNKLIEVYNKENKEDRNLLASNTITFIDERLRTLTSDLSGTERAEEEFKRRNQVTDVRSEAASYQQEATDYTKQLSELDIRLDVVRSLQRYLSQKSAQFELVPSTFSINEPSLQELVGKFNELQLQRQRLLRDAEPANPLILNINDQLAQLRLSMLENLRSIANGLTVTRGSLAAKANNFQSRINQVPSIERELNAINRQAGVKRDLYVYLLQKREESALSLAATVSNTRVIDSAIASKKPLDPNKPLAYGLALVFGLLIPFGFVFLRDFFADTVQEQKDITQVTTAPVLGEIGHYPGKGLLAVADAKRPQLAEQFRLLRSNLDFATTDREKQVILVTSSRDGEGKTFIALNLAISLSLTGKKVVLLDLNLRQPGVLAGLGLEEGAGATNFMSQSTLTAASLLRPAPVNPDLAVIGTGGVPANPAETLMHPRVGELVAQLRQQFDHVIIDSAPVGQVADAFALAPYLDATVLVVRCNFTPKARLDLLHDITSQEKLPQALVILNDVRVENSYAAK
ncbi:GumC family protein [Hymenobacter sp. B1770]|uniref:GumC family protein n=1 Tax=Hymenobacter sp. B1770 TaxID=1718788 RepID=UPI003CE6D9F4